MRSLEFENCDFEIAASGDEIALTSYGVSDAARSRMKHAEAEALAVALLQVTRGGEPDYRMSIAIERLGNEERLTLGLTLIRAAKEVGDGNG